MHPDNLKGAHILANVHENTMGRVTAFESVSFGFDYRPKPSSPPNKAPQK